MPALDVSPCDIQPKPGLPFGGKPYRIDTLGDLQGLACIAEVDGNRDPVRQDIGRPEFRLEVVAICAEPIRHVRSCV